MSLLWPNQRELLVAIGADQLSAILRTGFAKNILLKHHENFEKSTADQAWKLGIQKLDKLLATNQLPQNTQLSLTIASDLVRYIVLPGQEIAMRSNEKLAYAHAAFLEIYGAVADNWKICVDDTAPAQPSLASAIDIAMYESIVELAQKYNLKLTSVQPYLMTAFNKLFSSIKNANASFVIIEQTRIATLYLKNGVCQQLNIEKFTSDWQLNLQQTLARNRLLSSQTSKELLIYAPSLTSIKQELPKNFLCKRLSVKTNNDALPYSFSMLEALA